MRRFAHLVKGISQASWGRHRGGAMRRFAHLVKGISQASWGEHGGERAQCLALFFLLFCLEKRDFYTPRRRCLLYFFLHLHAPSFRLLLCRGLHFLFSLLLLQKKKQIYTNLSRLRRRAPLPDEESGKGRVCP